MMQFGQLPEWVDMGDDSDQDFVTPSLSLAEQLKKRIKQPKPEGGLGAGIGQMADLGDSGGALAGMGAAKGGMKSL